MFAAVTYCGKNMIKKSRHSMMNSFRHFHKKPGGDKVKEKVKGSPSGPWSRFSNTQLVIAGGSLLGLGCLSYYGTNMAGMDSRVTMGLAMSDRD